MGIATRVESIQGYTVELDLADQVLSLDVPQDRETAWDNRENDAQTEAPISPSLPASTSFASASMLAQKAKCFDDGLVAAVELASESGAGNFPGKAGLLAGLGRALAKEGLAPDDGAAAVLFAALEAGGQAVDAGRHAGAATAALKEFLADDLRSKPIGFYTWSQALSRIFRRDRMLQTPIARDAGAAALASALHQDEALRSAYEAALRLAERLTNPFAAPDLRPALADLDAGRTPAIPGDARFLPPSRARETELLKALFGSKPIPEGFDLLTEMISGIRSGTLDLKPLPSSGWYDRVAWSLETLAAPERAPEAPKLKLGDGYVEKLHALFKTVLALARETHIKQLEVPMCGACCPDERAVELDVYPRFSAEPLAEHYRRRAEGYAFVRGVLEDCFGAEALAAMRRLGPDGPSTIPLDRELASMEALFCGAACAVREDLGLEVPDAQRRHLESFRGYARSFPMDPDLNRDLRMMVPVAYDAGRKLTKAWLFLGWAVHPLTVRFARAPKARVLGPNGKPAPEGSFVLNFNSNTYELAYPVTAEAYVPRVLDRDEFRLLCDDKKTRAGVLAAL